MTRSLCVFGYVIVHSDRPSQVSRSWTVISTKGVSSPLLRAKSIRWLKFIRLQGIAFGCTVLVHCLTSTPTDRIVLVNPRCTFVSRGFPEVTRSHSLMRLSITVLYRSVLQSKVWAVCRCCWLRNISFRQFNGHFPITVGTYKKSNK